MRARVGKPSHKYVFESIYIDVIGVESSYATGMIVAGLIEVKSAPLELLPRKMRTESQGRCEALYLKARQDLPANIEQSLGERDQLPAIVIPSALNSLHDLC